MRKLSEMSEEERKQAKSLIKAAAILGGIAIVLLIWFIIR